MTRSKFLGVVTACVVLATSISPTVAQNASKTPLSGAALPATDAERIAELVSANHILANQGVVDGFGHISVRSAANPRHYFMARSLAPALVTRDDILEFDENSNPVNARGPQPYGERFIHGEIYRARPDVNSVAHSHSSEVLPFTVTKTPLKALIHVAAFLGAEAAPVFDLRNSEGPENLMLISNVKSGADLAKTLGNRSVVLMRGHGMAVAAPTTRDAVLRAIYTRVNAQVQMEAMKMGEPVFMSQFEATRVDPIARQWPLWVEQAEANRKAR
jgi:ribulose-5-phosphate 4-epimerase/fuculose-1-phosphate aldolase